MSGNKIEQYFEAFWFYCSQEFLNYLVYQSFDLERTWWRWSYLMNVIVPDERDRTWWRWSYLMNVIVPDERDSRSASCSLRLISVFLWKEICMLSSLCQNILLKDITGGTNRIKFCSCICFKYFYTDLNMERESTYHEPDQKSQNSLFFIWKNGCIELYTFILHIFLSIVFVIVNTQNWCYLENIHFLDNK